MRKLKLVDGKRRADKSVRGPAGVRGPAATINSPLALTFEAEVKRYSIEQDVPVAEIMERLAMHTGLTTGQLYNYRSGKTDIPASLIPEFCRQFKSASLAMTLIGLCEIENFEVGDAMDLAAFCARMVINLLEGGKAFMEITEDGKVDGHELIRMKNVAAKITRDVNRSVEITEQMRRRAA